MAKGKGMELVTVDQYAITSKENINQVLEDNIGRGQITTFDFERYKVPSGGGTSWNITGLDGEEEAVKEIKGVIINWVDKRVYWEKQEPSGERPDCTSEDSETGIGMPGGECCSCQYAQFGSGKSGRGQACKQVRVLFIVNQSGLLPVVMQIPPTSLKPFKQYFLKLASNSISFFEVETAIGLKRVKNEGGQDYAVVSPRMSRSLDRDTINKVVAYREKLSPAMNSVKAKETVQ